MSDEERGMLEDVDSVDGLDDVAVDGEGVQLREFNLVAHDEELRE